MFQVLSRKTCIYVSVRVKKGCASSETSCVHSPSGVAVSFLRPELEGARLVGPCWCSGDFIADMIICCRAAAGFVELGWSLYWSAGVRRID